MKTLADLRKAPPKSRPERSVTVCLAGHLVAKVQPLIEELSSLPLTRRLDDDESEGPPKRSGQGADPRAAKIKADMAEILDEMAEHEGELVVVGYGDDPDGEWRRWANAHPARRGPEPATAQREAVEAEPGWQRDQEVTLGYCNADDLIEDLGKYAYTWNGEPLGDGDWDKVFRPNLGGADLKQIATSVVNMHETHVPFRQWRSGLSATLRASNASASPAPSKSPRAGSTAGNPRKSSAATTKKATKSR